MWWILFYIGDLGGVKVIRIINIMINMIFILDDYECSVVYIYKVLSFCFILEFELIVV